MIDVQDLIATRRDGRKHTKNELFEWAKAAAQAEIPDYQLAAWLMAAYLRPLDRDETAWLTEGMARSGDIMDLSGLPKPWVDKHSTGGVGDKTSIALLPILAACGLTIVKMSGRGLGITGGTIDKLSAIPGFSTNLSPDAMKDQALRIGLALTGQTPDLAPADKVFYALRDATETVESMPLIVSSILSKKMAGGADTIVLDVKCGSGAFMTTEARAREMAAALTDVGQRLGLNVRLAITDMSQPLGSAVGNALEVREAVQAVTGQTLDAQAVRFKQLVIQLAAHTLCAAGQFGDLVPAVSKVEQVLDSGAAKEKMRAWFRAQGATVDVVEHLDALPKAPIVKSVSSLQSGSVASIDARTVGLAVVRMGGGRTKKEDPIDVRVGIEMLCQVGSKVAEGDPLFRVHAAGEESCAAAAEQILAGIQISEAEVVPPPLILAFM